VAAASPIHGLGGRSLTMGGCPREYWIYGRCNSVTANAVGCPRSDGVTMMVSDGGEMLTQWSSGPDHIEPTLWPCYGKNGGVGRGRAAGRCASAQNAKNRNAFRYHVTESDTHVSNRIQYAYVASGLPTCVHSWEPRSYVSILLAPHVLH